MVSLSSCVFRDDYGCFAVGFGRDAGQDFEQPDVDEIHVVAALDALEDAGFRELVQVGGGRVAGDFQV